MFSLARGSTFEVTHGGSAVRDCRSARGGEPFGSLVAPAIAFGRETVEDEFAQVESIVINAKGEEMRVIYRLRRADGKWKVYDALVENVSIINNYRSQFDRIISKFSFHEPKKLLREKSRINTASGARYSY